MIDDRALDIVQLRQNGKSLQEVANIYGLTRERVRQIEAVTLRELNGKVAPRNGDGN